MQGQAHKPYFNQIAMIESQYESKRKAPLSSASLLQTRSPLRERERESKPLIMQIQIV